jgi:tetratricopeptide (TPR) repeat protein
MTGLPESVSSDPKCTRATAGTYVVRALLVVAAIAVLSIVGYFIREQFLPTDTLYKRAADALDRKPQPDYDTAHNYALRILDREPDSNQAKLLVAATLAPTDRFEEAFEYLGQVPDDGSPESVQARCAAGDLLLNRKQQPSDALDQFEQAFEQDPDNAIANTFLAHLDHLGTRTWDMVPHSVVLAKQGLLSPRQLYELSLGHELHTLPDFIQEYSKVVPDDPIVLLGQADIASNAGEFDEAEELYRRVIAGHPTIIAAHVRLGSVLLQTRDAAKFYNWHAGLPDEAERHPLTWSIRGAWAEEQRDSDVAIRCYWECVRLDPNHLPAVYQLGRLLTAAGRTEDARPFLHRARLLELYVQAARHPNLLTDQEQPDLNAALAAAILAGELGLFAEADAWFQLILQRDENFEQAKQAEAQLQDLLPQITDQRAAAAANPALHIDLSDYPLPDWTAESLDDSILPPTSAPGSRVSFEDKAAAAGMVFTFFKGGDPDIRGLTRAYRFTGGGVAVLDLDCDGWPDIHLTQGAESPEQGEQSLHVDALFRNDGSGLFSDVSGPARVLEGRYSQGATVGDFNCDGFPDLRVANIGGNRLFQNNGDGTFDDVSDPAGVAGTSWTTSCLLADLNGDGLPDLYDVNFLEGQNLFTTVCRDEEGPHHACMPAQFPASHDELFLNRGDGTFENVTAECGILVPYGKGLGIVAADMDGSGRLNLFVANDGVANFYFVNETSDPAAPSFSEQAVLLGAAYNRDGRPGASMGVAVGDADHDGRLELFVTGFFEETNTLYRMQGDNLFLDDTVSAGLAEPGRRMLGFGTQFIDGALRGQLDLIVTNGHINAYDVAGIPYEMPPQYFSNIGDGRFVESDAATLGRYFAGAYLGRSLARIDWNRDGREDVVISHLDAPAALLTNTTAHAGHYLALHLVGTHSSRDAIGATLTLTADGRTQYRQLTAGDGYQASNERIIIFGLADATIVDSLSVRWPSGAEQQFADLEADREYLCVEGSNRLHQIVK